MTEMENWNEFSTTVLDYAKQGTMDEVDTSYVRKQIEKGTANPNRQSRISTAIRETVRDYNDSPFANRGFSLPSDAQGVVDDAIAAVTAMGEAFGSSKALQALWIPHGKCKFSHFTDGAHWASYHADKIQSEAESLYKSETFTGTVKSLTDTIGGSL
jgi:hypothetical protein